MPKLAKWLTIKPTKALLICGLLILLSGCIKRYNFVDAPPPPAASHAAQTQNQ